MWKQFPNQALAKKIPFTIAFKWEEDRWAFCADLIPVVPYPAGGGFNPYPIFTREVRDKVSGKILARTRTVAPASTEMGCKNRHDGFWRVAGEAGFG